MSNRFPFQWVVSKPDPRLPADKQRVVISAYTAAFAESNERDRYFFLTEEQMLEVADWCRQNSCGRRTAFATFDFKNQAELSMFLLKWS